jgi:bifunctional non-homologous end joining protein LigD
MKATGHGLRKHLSFYRGSMPVSAMDPAAVVAPMLASRPRNEVVIDGVPQGFGEDWIFEPKLDGFRCLVHVVDGAVTLRSRSGNDITRRFSGTPLPTIGGARTVDPAVIDGELIVVDDRGRPSFNRLQQVNGRPADPIAVFIAFDLLYHPVDLDVRDQPWTARRSLLEELEPSGLTLTPYSSSVVATWDAVVSQGLEGVIAKRKSSRYQSGRAGDWIKLKRHRSLSALAIAFNTGEGSRVDSFGSLAMALLDASGELIHIGDVGTGFAQADLATIRSLDLPFVIEVEFQEWTGSALRMPVFKGLRQDVSPSDCTFAAQLPEARAV